MYDVIIIGQGPAGYTAGIYCVRRNLKTLIVGEVPGGKMSWTTDIENYTGFRKTTGPKLTEKMKSHVKDLGCEIIQAKVSKIEPGFKVYFEDKIEEAKSVIIATGTLERRLGIEGEEELRGKGVSYCSTCDGPLFKDKPIAVVGGSDTAVKAAEYLATIGEKVYLIHRRDQFRAEEANVEKVKNNLKIELVLNAEVTKINGKDKVESITLKDGKELKVDAVFIHVGVIPTTEVIKDIKVELDDRGFIKVNEKMETNVKGVFAAGDVRGGILQIVQATGDGATAAMSAYMYVKSQEEDKPYFIK